jgi:hypothetical protein
MVKLEISCGGEDQWCIFSFIMCLWHVPEMQPQWFPEESIPYEKMWPDDILWYPLYLKGIKFKGYFLYQGHDSILEYTLTPVDHLPQ